MSPKVQHLTLPFKIRDQPGKIHITLQPNQDHNHAWGLDLIYPSIPKSDFAKQFFGFPVIQAAIEYPIPPSPSSASAQPSGYRSLFGWIQVVKTSIPGKGTEGEWEMDIYPSFKEGSNNPFVYWGYKPTLFDAPARLVKGGGEKDGLRWRAQTFLCVVEDAGMGRSVRVCEGGGLRWGFDITPVQEGEESGDVRRKIELLEAEVLDLSTEWNGQLELLRMLYPGWVFTSHC